MSTNDKELSQNAQNLLRLIPLDGSFVGNTTLRRKSNLSGDDYWAARKELEALGLIILGKGRGGSVARFSQPPVIVSGTAVAQPEIPPSPPQTEPEELVDDENELYEPLKKLLDEDWGAEAKETEDFFELRITATPKARPRNSGQWSRPDLTLVEVNTFEFLPGANLEVTTFEVKRFADSQNIASVFETAAHSRWAHYAYLVAEVPNEEQEFPERFISELKRFRIGLMIMWRKAGKWRFSVITDPERHVPDPKELESLLKTFFSDGKRVKDFKKAVK